jgi:hypothetical protein
LKGLLLSIAKFNAATAEIAIVAMKKTSIILNFNFNCYINLFIFEIKEKNAVLRASCGLRVVTETSPLPLGAFHL